MSGPPPSSIRSPLDNLRTIESQYRWHLNARWFGFVVRSMLYVGAVNGMSTAMFTRSAWSTWTGFWAGAVLFLSIYPIIALRRSQVYKTPTNGPRRATWSMYLTAIRSRIYLQFLLFATLFTVGWCLVVNRYKPEYDLGIFRPTKRYPWHLNERFVFLWSAMLFYYGIYGILDAGDINPRPAWPRNNASIKTRVLGLLRSYLASFPDDRISYIWPLTVLFVFSYWLLSKRVATFFAFRIGFGVSALIRPLVINIARGRTSLMPFRLVPHFIWLASSAFLALKMPSLVYSVYITQPLDFSRLLRGAPMTPDAYMAIALLSKQQVYINLTLLELVKVSHNPVRRRAIFADTSKPQCTTHRLWQELLLQLGRVHQQLATRGGQRVLSAPTQPPQPAARDPRALTLKQGDIYRPAARPAPQSGIAGFLQGLRQTTETALDGPIETAAPKASQVASAGFFKTKARFTDQIDAQVQSVRQRTQQILPRYQPKEGTPLSLIWALVPSYSDSHAELLGQQWAESMINSSFSNDVTAKWILEVFATLAVASADEDQFGHVQTVLPATLEAIVRFRSALISFENELKSMSGVLGERASQFAQTLVSARVGETVQACDDSVLRIARRFGSSLGAFKFPQAVSSSLQGICRSLEQIEVEQDAQQ